MSKSVYSGRLFHIMKLHFLHKSCLMWHLWGDSCTLKHLQQLYLPFLSLKRGCLVFKQQKLFKFKIYSDKSKQILQIQSKRSFRMNLIQKPSQSKLKKKNDNEAPSEDHQTSTWRFSGPPLKKKTKPWSRVGPEVFLTGRKKQLL